MAKALVWEPDYLERKISNAVQTPNVVVVSPEAQEALHELYESDLESAARSAAKSLVQDGPIVELENLKDRLEQKVKVFVRASRAILKNRVPTDTARHITFTVLVFLWSRRKISML